MNDDEFVAISALEHHVYCPRQCALIHVDGAWADNEHTLRGTRGHRRADTGADRVERARKVLRGVPLWSERWGLVGRADVVEILGDGSTAPVEYKIGGRQGRAAEVQLCAQALCLEEMLGCSVSIGYVWYARPRRRDRIAIDASLRAETEAIIAEVRANLASPVLPPAPDDARCDECQLLDMCIPSLVAHPERLDRYLKDVVCAS